MNHKFCITGVSWRQRVKERSVVIYITPMRRQSVIKKFANRVHFIIEVHFL